MSDLDRSRLVADALAIRRAHAARSLSLPDTTDRESALDLLLAAAAADRRLAAADRRRAAEYLHDAYRDDLTGALNRRPGRDQMRVEIERAHRSGAPLTIVFVDVDGLKDVNDTVGHDAGDRLLAAAGSALRANLRSYDLIVRYGGDEFVCALPGAAIGIAEECCERALRTLARRISGATFSAGYGQLQSGDSLEALVGRADADLYRRRAATSSPYPASAPAAVAASRPDPSEGATLTGDPPSVECGACGGCIPLADFALVHSARMTLSAICRQCGDTTFVQLARRR